LDTSRAYEKFGFKAQVGFEEGLKETIQWFREHQQEIK
jgi:GDP-L-fucose synthase